MLEQLATTLRFASDAEILTLWGLGFVALALFAMVMDQRRSKNRHLERLEKVGFVPWTAIFLGSLIVGGGVLALALPQVIAG